MEQGFDPQIAAQELQRRRALLAQMQQQSMQQPIQGPQGLAQLATKLATAYILGQKEKGLAGQERQYADQYQSALQGEMGQYMDRMQGQSAVKQFGATPEAESTQVAAAVAPNPQEAVTQAMLSRLPEMQKIGAAGMAQIGKSTLTPKDILGLPGFEAGSRVNAANALDPSLLKPEKKFITAADQIFDTSGDKPTVAADARMTFNTPEKIGGDLYQTEARPGGQARKLDNAPKVSLGVNPTIINGKGETAFVQEFGKNQAEAFKEAGKQAEMGYAAKSMVAQLQKLEQGEVFNTPVPNAAIRMGQFAQAVGLPVDKGKLANSEAYQQQIAKRVAEILTSGAGVGRSMTNEDREAFMRSLPELLSSPQGRQQVYAQLLSGADTAIKRHASMQEAWMQSPLMKDYEGILKLNTIDQNPGPGVLSPQVPAVPASPASAKPIVKGW